MKIPQSPPSFSELLNRISKDSGAMGNILTFSNSMVTGDEYLHWDKLRFKPLPDNLPEEMKLEEYWCALKFNRMATRKLLPFHPKGERLSKFYFTRPDCLLAGLRHIDLKSGGAVTSGSETIGRSDGQRFLARSVIEEPFSSSVLEGAATTRRKAQALIENGELPRNKDEQMVLNNYRAMMFIKDQIDDDLTPEVILECHRIVTEKTLDRPEMAGKYRDSNDIVVGDIYGEVFHEPPNFNELEDRMTAICAFANQSEASDSPFIHPITRAIILHFMLAYDHPFVDGNGRTARALFYWSVLRSGYWMMEYISISKIIKGAATQYGRAFLYTETDDNDVTYFLVHQLGVIKKAIAELEQYLDRQKLKYKKIERLLSAEKLNHRQEYLLSEFIRKRMRSITIVKHQKIQAVAYLTARKDLEELEESKWLLRRSFGRKYIYSAGPKLVEIQQ